MTSYLMAIAKLVLFLNIYDTFVKQINAKSSTLKLNKTIYDTFVKQMECQKCNLESEDQGVEKWDLHH